MKNEDKIGLIGTGILGNAVGLHLLESGFSLTVYNRTKEKTKQIESKGAQIAQSPKIVAENSELVIIVLKDADVVKKISFGQDRKSTRLNSSHMSESRMPSSA